MRSIITSTRILLSWVTLLLLSCRTGGPTYPQIDPDDPLPTKTASVPSSTSESPPPISLTASDGTGLTLASLRAGAVLEDPLAFTEIELAFDNPYDHVVEGRFEILLPPGAQMTRFAMEIGGSWQEAEIVEKQRARRTYESFLHQERDPALLERDTGNRFRARVFPIQPHERKRLIVSYLQTFDDPSQPYRLDTRGLPALERLDLEVQIAVPGTETYRVEERHLVGKAPTEDLVIERDAASIAGFRQGEHVIARIEPLEGRDPGETPPLERLTVLFDTSASRALDYDDTVEGLGHLLSALRRRVGTRVKLKVLAFDQEVVAIYEGPLSGFGPDALAALHRRRPLGASDLQNALAALRGGKHQRILLVSDGLISAGSESNAALHDELEALTDTGVQRLDALIVGGVRDDARLEQLVRGVLPESGIVLEPSTDLEHAVDRLMQATVDDVQIDVPGASWWSPTRVDGMQPGDHVLVYAELPADRPLVVQISGPLDREQPIELQPMTSPMIERAWMGARIGAHVHELTTLEDKRSSATLRQRIVTLSVEHRILNDFTAFLVLETENDYARFGLDRRALSDIMVVRPSGVIFDERVASVDSIEIAPDPSEPRLRGIDSDTASAEVETSAGRVISMEEFRNIPIGASAGRDFASVVVLAPTASMSRAGITVAGTTGSEVSYAVDGRLSSPRSRPYAPKYAQVKLKRTRIDEGTISRRHAKSLATAHIDEIQQCYWNAQSKDPFLRGRLVLSLRVTPEGDVLHVTRERQIGLRDSEVVDCVVQNLLTWSYGLDTGPGSKLVTQTFVFRPRDGVPPGFGEEPPELAPGPGFGPTHAPWTGTFAEVRAQIERGDRRAASETAWAWRRSAPTDVLAVVALGEAATALGNLTLASRAYGSILDLYPSRADMRRFAAGRLEALDEAALELAIDAYRKAREQRPDHPSSHRSLAFALLRNGDVPESFEAISRGLLLRYPTGRFAEVQRILKEDLGIIAAVWMREQPTEGAEIRKRLAIFDASLAERPSLRFVLTWETDANDVDLHVHDRRGNHAFFQTPELSSGGRLYADVTNGFGPECFTVPEPKAAYPYRLAVHYYSRGPMGYGMGRVQVLHHDGEGRISLDDRPFVVMEDQAYVELGSVQKPTRAD